MVEKRLNSCCARAVAEAQLRDYSPTQEDLAWLFSLSRRWVTELRKRGVLPEGEPLPKLVKRMARYKPEARRSARRAKLSKNA